MCICAAVQKIGKFNSYHGVIYLRSLRCLGKACCEACPVRLIASGVGLSGGCKAGLTLKE